MASNDLEASFLLGDSYCEDRREETALSKNRNGGEILCESLVQLVTCVALIAHLYVAESQHHHMCLTIARQSWRGEAGILRVC